MGEYVVPQESPAWTVLTWLLSERGYARSRWSDAAHDGLLRDEGVGPTWRGDINDYLNRAAEIGIEDPLGRQAAFKALSVAWNLCESIVRVVGDPPPGGIPSGEVSQ